MQIDKTIPIIQALDNLLTLTSLHLVSHEFDKIAETLKKEKLTIEIIESKSYYLIEELNSLFEMKSNAEKFEEKAMLRLKEKELLVKYADTEAGTLKQEPSFFEYKDNRIIAYLSKNKETERLIWNLIEAYLLKKTAEKIK
jgi:hypothetical protein